MAAAQPTIYTVSGIIYDEHNTPMPNVQVKVFEVDIRSQKELGNKTTDAKGFYSLSFNGVIARPEYKAPDIMLQVFNGNGVQLGLSPIYFNVQELATIDFKIGNSAIKTTNEFDALLQTIQLIIGPAQISLGSLQENDNHKDISFIAGETGESAEKIDFINTAFALSKPTHIAPDIFYALFRMGLTVELKELLMIKSTSIKNSLQQAIDENIISSKWEKGLDKIIIVLNELSVKKIIDGDDEQSASFKKFFGAALSAEQQKIFTATYFDNEDAPEIFWDKLKTRPGFTDAAIKKTKQLLSLNLLAGNQPQLAQHLFSKQASDPDLEEMSGYAKFTKEGWKQQITAAAVTSFPAWVKGSNEEEKKEHYAESLEQLHKQLYPTSFFAARMKQDGQSAFAAKEQLDTFFKKNPGFQLDTKKIRKQLEAANFENIADMEKVKAELKTINRLYKLTDDYKQVDALYGKQLFSSADIVAKYGRQQFVKEFSTATGSAAMANMLYRKAVSVNNKTTALITAYKMRNDVKVYAINGDAPDPEGYHEIFADGELCECEHCQSVYSPAAYFTDMLNFIKSESEDEAYAELLRRRPDLDDILLTCKNTNTPLPYIDLVNELLEKEVLALQAANDTERIAIRNQSYQTEGTAEELMAMPEHINSSAYEQLKTVEGDAVFSTVLPIDFPLDEIRIYTEKLGLKRYELMDSFYGSNEPGRLNDANLAAELFGFSKAELDIINGTEVFTAALPGTVKAILDKTKFTYIELLQLLGTYFLNPVVDGRRKVAVKEDCEANEEEKILSCNLDKLLLCGADDAWLNKTVRFLRLWKKLGWDIFDLDRTLTAIGVDSFPGTEAEFNEKLLLPLANIERAKRFLNIPLRQLITLFSNVDVAVYLDHTKEGQPAIPSLYQQVFQNKTVIDDFASSPFNKDAAALSGVLAEQTETLCAVLGITAAELEILAPAAELNIENISRLYRDVLLARSLKAPIADVKETIKITNTGTATGVWNPVQLLQFLEEWKVFKSSGIKANEFEGIITNNKGAGYLLEVDSALIEMVQQNIDALNTITEPQLKEKYAERLQLFLDALSENVALKDSLALALSGQDDIALKNIIDGYFGDKNKEALGLLTSEELIEKLGQLKKSLSGYLFLKTTPQIFKQFRFLPDEVKWLQSNRAGTGTDKLWLSPVDINDAGLYIAFRKLLHISQVAKIKTGTASSWVKLFDIAIGNAAGAKAAWFDELTSLYAVAEPSLVFLCGSIDEVNNKGRLNFSFPEHYLSAENILTILNCCKIIEKLGSNDDQLQALLGTAVVPADTQAVKNLLKSKYGNKEWLDAIKPINDGLRTKRRDALVAWLLANANGGAWHSSNDLYEWLLIDVEMDACMVTSRLKQGISSIQLFIDRCLMNLETTPNLQTEDADDTKKIILGEEFSEQWHTWRKQYRVWEANRKIFLYPENWIEPDLRDDKSPFFKELESQLKQNEVTEDTAKEALIAYLHKLDTVANLEMVGLFNDEETKIVHVFGRTHNIPHQYFYRKQQNNVWTAWEKVELDIEGDHILPVVWNGRLMLFWGMFTEKEERGGGFEVPGKGDLIEEPAKYFELKLAWSEYKNGKFGAKKLSKGYLKTPPNSALNHFQFSSLIDKGRLLIRLFGWYNPDYKYLNNLGLGVFVFDGCNNSPSIIGQLGFHNPFLEEIKLSTEIIADSMFLLEKPIGADSGLTLYDSGLFHKIGSTSTFNIFLNTPGIFHLLPNHHEIENDKRVIFFYGNSENNLFATSVEKFNNIPDLIVPGNDTILIARKSMDKDKGKIKERTNVSIEAGAGISIAGFAGIDGIAAISQIPDSVAINPYKNYKGKKYIFQTFYHPYVCSYIKKLNSEGIDFLYRQNIQNREPKKIFTSTEYKPTPLVLHPYPLEEVDFSYKGAYSIYNWELFFHAPLLIATRLTHNQKFEEARKWFHYIFDPTKSANGELSAERFWITKPFRKEIEEGVLSLEDLLNREGNAEELDMQLTNWEQNPFNSHAVARLRISAYMRNTVLRYIDNLIQWGDQLFRRDTIESINEATLLYILASNILGKKQETVPARAKPVEQSFSTIENKLDPFSNVKSEIESFISSSSGSDNLLMPYFCLPKNNYLLKYWDTVADRLFKIRHCMNIEGVVRQLPLFEPPIDPALLVRATAAGLNLNEILNELNASLPHYRFQVMLQQANELCNDVKSLGSSLLSALEKKDGEELSLLRSAHELRMLEMIKDIKEKQRDEAKESVESILSSRKIIEAKHDYYDKNLSVGRNDSEEEYFNKLWWSLFYQELQSTASAASAIFYQIPDTHIGGWCWGITHGGRSYGAASSALSNAMSGMASYYTYEATKANTNATYQRREEEWKYQSKSAELELKQIDKQIIAAEIRLAIAEKEIENHNLQMEQSKEVDDYMRGKFTNTELYDWMLGQLSTVYFQSYQLAYSTAKKAEKCMQHELGLESTNYIQFGYWDSLKKGLLSGEKLQYDLRRLENAYLEENKRELEITKHISLALIDPLQILMLRQKGTCDINLPEELFDLDFPGHYFRRIKAVTISIPCVAGPYTSVNATLRLVYGNCRVSTEDSSNYAMTEEEKSGIGRFRKTNAVITSIATSSGQHDSGMFELNFRDERYLPFEGCGAISSWKLELNNEFRQFDYNSISDIILHLQYTARENTLLKDKATENLKNYFASAENNAALLPRAFSLKRNFPDAFHQLANATPAKASIEISSQQFAFLFNHTQNPVNKIKVYILPKGQGAVQHPESFKIKVYILPQGQGVVLHPEPFTINEILFEGWSSVDTTSIIMASQDVQSDNFQMPFILEIAGNGGGFSNFTQNIEDVIIVLR